MTRIILNLSDAEQAALYHQAQREFRAPRDQARLLLMRALGFIEGEARHINPQEAVTLYGHTIIDAGSKPA
jgi:hypothetical protein